MVSGGAPAIGCDLATGTTAPSRAQRRWPILDVHDVKQQNANKRVVSRSRKTQVHDARAKFENSLTLSNTRAYPFTRTSMRVSKLRAHARIDLPFVRTCVRASFRHACTHHPLVGTCMRTSAGSCAYERTMRDDPLGIEEPIARE